MVRQPGKTWCAQLGVFHLARSGYQREVFAGHNAQTILCEQPVLVFCTEGSDTRLATRAAGIDPAWL